MTKLSSVEWCKIMFIGATSYSLVQSLSPREVLFSHNAQCHTQTDRQIDGQKTVWCQ